MMGTTTAQKLFLDFHVIQTVPPSCVNRDDTGSPKTAVYGGVRRARVSSQCWKNAMRKMFREHLDETQLGVRTKDIVELIMKKLIKEKGVPDDGTLADCVIETINMASKKKEKPIIPEKKKNKKSKNKSDSEENEKTENNDKNDETQALFFIGGNEAEKLAELIRRWKEKQEKPKSDEVLNALNATFDKQAGVYLCHAIDVDLFGRLITNAPMINADASAQVAHAISTHAAQNEFDYYTARDDRKPHDEPDASMIGTVEFNSATLYRYATVAVHDLFRQLGDDADALAEAVREFARAFALSMPTGKQNSFANRTTPNAVMVTLRTDRPVNLADAFEEPVRQSETGGFAKCSAKRLEEHAEEVYRAFDCPPEKSWLVGNIWNKGAETIVCFTDLLKLLESEMRGRFASREEGSPS
jgi:CRISPR system Cascade subunit CasC